MTVAPMNDDLRKMLAPFRKGPRTISRNWSPTKPGRLPSEVPPPGDMPTKDLPWSAPQPPRTGDALPPVPRTYDGYGTLHTRQPVETPLRPFHVGFVIFKDPT